MWGEGDLYIMEWFTALFMHTIKNLGKGHCMFSLLLPCCFVKSEQPGPLAQ